MTFSAKTVRSMNDGSELRHSNSGIPPSLAEDNFQTYLCLEFNFFFSFSPCILRAHAIQDCTFRYPLKHQISLLDWKLEQWTYLLDLKLSQTHSMDNIMKYIFHTIYAVYGDCARRCTLDFKH